MEPPPLRQRMLSYLAPAAAAWTGFTLRHDLLQHPKLLRRAYRTTPWVLRTGELGELRVSMERALHSTLVKIDGALDRASARRLATGIRAHLHLNDAHLKVVIAEGTQARPPDLRFLARELASLRHRISLSLPSTPETWGYLESA